MKEQLPITLDLVKNVDSRLITIDANIDNINIKILSDCKTKVYIAVKNFSPLKPDILSKYISTKTKFDNYKLKSNQFYINSNENVKVQIF